MNLYTKSAFAVCMAKEQTRYMADLRGKKIRARLGSLVYIFDEDTKQYKPGRILRFTRSKRDNSIWARIYPAFHVGQAMPDWSVAAPADNLRVDPPGYICEVCERELYADDMHTPDVCSDCARDIAHDHDDPDYAPNNGLAGWYAGQLRIIRGLRAGERG